MEPQVCGDLEEKMEPQICGDLEEMRPYRGKRKAPHLGERGFSRRDIHNAEGGPDPRIRSR